jgi:translation initiation factor 3 subunit H
LYGCCLTQALFSHIVLNLKALLKIVKHCHESLPSMVTGSLLGLAVENGVLEITHAFPLPSESKTHSGPNDPDDEAAGLEGHEFQLEMMRMLREVNVDNNCVGWYQSMYLGVYSTSSLLDTQLNYQTELSPNAVVILYDPMQTSHGNLVLKCFRLTDECIRIREEDENIFIDSKNIFEEIPVKLTNPGLVQALLLDVAEGAYVDPMTGESGLYDAALDTTFDRLDLSTNPYLEKHLEFMSGWVDDLAAEQHKFQYYSRQLARGGNDRFKKRGGKKDFNDSGEGWASNDAPRRMESLLISNQISEYCDQVDKYATAGLSKLFVTSGLHKEK